jgi:hypothetical protein
LPIDMPRITFCMSLTADAKAADRGSAESNRQQKRTHQQHERTIQSVCDLSNILESNVSAVLAHEILMHSTHMHAC